MPDRRRIVVDSSALIPAFFPDGNRRIDQGSLSVLNAIQHRHVVAFAPEMLRVEFLGRAMRHIQSLRDAGSDRDTATIEVESQMLRFMQLDQLMTFTPGFRLVATAWDAACRYNAPAPDSWFLACACIHDAELWMSHPAEDGAGEAAKRYGVEVRYLSREMFAVA